VVQQYTTGSLIFGTNSTERARITSGGDFFLAQTGSQASERLGVTATGSKQAVSFKNDDNTKDNIVSWVATTGGNAQFIGFYTETVLTQRGSITYNRGAGLVAYNTTSDYRAKDIIGPVQNTGVVIDALKIYEGVMKGATQSRPMMIAHEAQVVVPFCVSGEKDAVNEDGTPKYQQMDHASLVPLLIAEIQSLRARVAALETK